MNGGDCSYDSMRDIHSVDQFGFIDITSALESGSIPSYCEPTDDMYNGIDSPEGVLGKPSDIFEAYRMNDYIQSYSSGDVGGSEPSGDVPDEN